jgi:hypothetical protein
VDQELVLVDQIVRHQGLDDYLVAVGDGPASVLESSAYVFVRQARACITPSSVTLSIATSFRIGSLLWSALSTTIL